MTTGTASKQQTLWYSRVIRWVLGIIFIIAGISYIHHEGWPVLVFGIIIFLTGFLKPRRCGDDGCVLPGNGHNDQ